MTFFNVLITLKQQFFDGVGGLEVMLNDLKKNFNINPILCIITITVNFFFLLYSIN